MATNVKCMWIFKADAGYGWTETHYLSIGSTPPINLQNVLNTMDSGLSVARRPLLGADCQIVGYRASYPVKGGIASASRQVFLPGFPGENSGSQNDSLATVMIDTTQTRKKIVHLRGFWDSVVQKDAYTPGNSPNDFAGKMTKYQAALIAGPYGWLGKDPNASVFGTVTDYTQGAADNVTFQCVLGPGSAAFSTIVQPPVGTGNPTYECRISKLNRSNSVLNRSFVVTASIVTGPPVVNQLTTVNPVATGPFIGAGRFNVTVPLFIQYAVAGSVSLGERRMGRVLFRYPGRSRRRAEI